MNRCLYLLLLLVLETFLSFPKLNAQTVPGFRTAELKATGIRLNLPADWKTAETQTVNVIRTEIFAGDTSLEAAVLLYREPHTELSDVIDKAIAEWALTEENRTYGTEIGGHESIILTGSAVIEEKECTGNLAFFTVGESQYVVLALFTTENSFALRKETFNKVIKSVQLLKPVDASEDGDEENSETATPPAVTDEKADTDEDTE